MSTDTYTIIRKDDKFVYAKQGCCGGTLKIPRSLGVIGPIGYDLEVRSKIVNGLTFHAVHIDGEWIEL